jgi:FtsH-binding integral membrane protein
MFKRNDIERTPKEQAERALMRTIARLGACGLLIYFVIKFLATTPQEPGSSSPVIIAIVFLALSAVVIVITIIDLINNIKAGAYNASTYESAEIAAFMANKKDENENAVNDDNNGDAASEDTDKDDRD